MAPTSLRLIHESMYVIALSLRTKNKATNHILLCYQAHKPERKERVTNVADMHYQAGQIALDSSNRKSTLVFATACFISDKLSGNSRKAQSVGIC